MSDAAKRFHETWLGMVQPIEGLVVSIPALIEADCFQRLPADDHRAFVDMLERVPDPAGDGERLRLTDVRALFTDGLGWSDEHLDTELPEALSLYIPEGPQTLRPTAAFRRPAYETTSDRHDGATLSDDADPALVAGADYRLLLWELPLAADGRCLPFDKPENVTGDWTYPPSKKLERLLRATRVPVGVLASHERIRLLYAPHGEAAGHIDFRVADMADVGGRPILDALVMLLGEERLVSVASDRQLPALLARSRAMQAEVTTALAKQVFFALETLMRGFEAADQRAGGGWLRPVMEAQAESGRDLLYEALLTVLLRLVFLLYAEDNALLPTEHRHFARHYSLYALFERLEDERTRYPDAMDRRYSAWPGLLSLFRAVYLGVSHGDLRIPAREGHLFNPHRFPFLEGFPHDQSAVPVRDADARAEAAVPTVDDETVYQVLRSLIILRGERLSYRTLYVEQIGSVYEGLMGYRSLRVVSPSARIKPTDSKHTPTWVSVEDLIAVAPAQREKWLKEHAGLKGPRAKALAQDIAALCKNHDGAALIDSAALDSAALDSAALDSAALIAALATRLHDESVKARPLAQPGRIVIQPGEERKRTSSHYTPQSLSGPIVARALEPLLACFGPQPTSAQILSLKICDPAMGSGAFLVEACRYLGERLLEAWTREAKTESLFSAEDDLTTFARRQIAERCLYGVDKNPFAVELAKLSLWLVTLQKDKPFTFLDHALRCGDSLVGVDLEQITAFHWKPPTDTKRGKGQPKPKPKKKAPVQLDLFHRELEVSLHEALRARERIAEMSQLDTAEANRDMRIAMDDADDALSRLRLIGDLLIGAFFSQPKDKAREQERQRRLDLVQRWLIDQNALGPPAELLALAEETRATLRPFHWAIEFPEVFYAGRPDPLTGQTAEEPADLDGVVGNPPFLGGKLVSTANGKAYSQWLESAHGCSQNTDLCAHFFRRLGRLLGKHGTLGMVATNTISQGDTRVGGLQPMLAQGFVIYDAQDSLPWPGDAAVSIATVHLAIGGPSVAVPHRMLNGATASVVNSRLRPTLERSDPVRLPHNANCSYVGTYTMGMGFIVDAAERDGLGAKSNDNAEKIFPYLGGQELNSSPTQNFERYVINLGRMTLDEASAWPDLLNIVRERVKPDRDKGKGHGMGAHGKKYWWQHAQRQDPLYHALKSIPRCLVTSYVSKHLAFAFQPTDRILANTLVVFPLPSWESFVLLQSRVHESWARLLSSSLEDRLRYAASDCFETFPFPKPSPKAEIPTLEAIGERLYQERAAFMIDTDQGLTKTYNALKDPTVTARSEHGPRILALRDLHLDMDRAVLQAYAEATADPTWTQIQIPPFTTPQTPTEKSLHQSFDDHILDKLFALNELRSR